MPPKRTTRTASKAANEDIILAAQPPAKKPRKEAERPRTTAVKPANVKGKEKPALKAKQTIVQKQRPPPRPLSPVIQVIQPNNENNEFGQQQGNDNMGEEDQDAEEDEDNRSVSPYASAIERNGGVRLPTSRTPWKPTEVRNWLSSTARVNNTNLMHAREPAGSLSNRFALQGREPAGFSSNNFNLHDVSRPRVLNVTNVGRPANDPIDRFAEAIVFVKQRSVTEIRDLSIG